MRTRLTDVLEVEHPVMLAGMGGVSYHELVAAVSEAGGFGCLGASTMAPERHGRGDGGTCRRCTDKPFGVDLLTASPGDMVAQVAGDHRPRRRACSSPGSACPATPSSSATSTTCSVVNMCGKVRHAIAAVEAGLRHRRRAGHRGRWPHRAGRHDGARPPDRRRRRRAGPGGRRRWASFDGRGSGGRALARRRRRLGRHPLHRHARGPRRVRATRTRCSRTCEDGTIDHRGLHRQDVSGGRQQVHPVLGKTIATSSSRSRCSSSRRWRTAPTTCTRRRGRPGRGRPRPGVLAGRSGRRRHRRARARGRPRALDGGRSRGDPRPPGEPACEPVLPGQQVSHQVQRGFSRPRP